MTMTGYNPNPLNGADFDVLQFNVGVQTVNPISSIPSGLVTVTPIPEINSNITRTLTFSPVTMGPNQLNGEFLINGATMDLNVINYTIPLDNTEIWELTNQSGISHPFHIHDVQFYILTRNGVAPAINEQGRKDVVLVRPQETVRFITKFETFSNDSVPYMYHCHMLTHEDGGMMGQFVVSNPLSVADNLINDLGISIFPNPSIGKITINFSEHPSSIIVYDVLGRERMTIKEFDNSQLTIEEMPKGINLIMFEYGNDRFVKKIIVN